MRRTEGVQAGEKARGDPGAMAAHGRGVQSEARSSGGIAGQAVHRDSGAEVQGHTEHGECGADGLDTVEDSQYIDARGAHYRDGGGDQAIMVDLGTCYNISKL